MPNTFRECKKSGQLWVYYFFVRETYVICMSFLVALAFPVYGQPAPVRIGPGVAPPRLIRKVEPEYSSLARADNVQGTVVLQIVVTESGRPDNIEVISPLGFGLDGKAEEAIRKWEFSPGVKGGMPVRVRATVEVNFRLTGLGFDQGFEERRTKFNVALQNLQRRGPKSNEESIKTILALAKQNFPAALYLVGKWETAGDNGLPKDAANGSAKIQKAAAKNYGPAIYEIALQSINDSSGQIKAWDKIRLAATLGSQGAQTFLGDRYQRGDGVGRDAGRAKNYFRLCAARGNADCQFRLAHLMFDSPDRPDYEYEQAIAWFELAAEQGVAQAAQIVESENPRLTAPQEKTIATLKRQFAGKFE